MTLRPIRSSRRNYRNRRARLANRNNWKPWKGWNPYHSFNGKFDPTAGFKVALLLCLSVGGFLALDYTFGGPFFHSYIFPPVLKIGHDPTTSLQKYTAPSSNNAEFNTAGSVSFSSTCTFFGVAQKCLQLKATIPPPPLAGMFTIPFGTLKITSATITPQTASFVYRRATGISSNNTFIFDVTGGHAQTGTWLITTSGTTTVTFYGNPPTVTCSSCISQTYSANHEVLVFGPAVSSASFTLIFTGSNLNFLGAMAESVSPIGDLSPVVAKELEIAAFWTPINNNTVTPVCGFAKCSWGFFLTTNSTLWKTTQNNWTPKNDSTVALFVEDSLSAGSPANGYTQQVWVQQKPGETILAEDTAGCGGSGYLCPSGKLSQLGVNGANSWLQFNFTGATNAAGVGTGNPCPTNGINGGPNCSYTILTDNFGGETYFSATPKSPAFPLSGATYYFGVWISQGQTGSGEYFCYDVGSCGPGFIPITNGCTSSSLEIDYCIPNPAASYSPPPTTDSGGFFGTVWHGLTAIGGAVSSFTQPIWGPIAGLGGSLLNDVLGALESVGSYVINVALPNLELAVQTVLNTIGNLLFPNSNIGTLLVNFFNDLLLFMTNTSYGLPAFFANFPTYFTQFLNYLQVIFPFITPMLNIAAAILGFGVSLITVSITIFTVATTLIFFGYGTLLIFLYVVFVCEDGVGGLLTFVGTAEAAAFGIVNIVSTLTNLGLDILITLISLIPKPFIQMNAGKIPRLPTLDSHARFTFPRFDFAELRAGNVVSILLLTIGFYLSVWFESRNPSLPGSIGSVVPGTAGAMQQLGTLLPLFQVFVEVGGATALFFVFMKPLQVLGVDIGEFAPIGLSAGGFQGGSGPSGVSIRAGKSHLAGFARSRIEKAGGKPAASPVVVSEGGPAVVVPPPSSQPALPEQKVTDAEFRVISETQE